MQIGPMLAEAENLDMKAVARVAQKATLEEIYLVDAKANRDPLVMPSETLSLKYAYSSNILQSTKDNLPIHCKFSVAAFNPKKPDNIVMTIEASFCVSYIIKALSDVNTNDIEQFSKINPIYNLWSYWREFVQSMTTRMGFPLLTIPLLTVIPKKPAKEQAKRGAKGKPTPRKKANA
jgi:preprotein translocase subunit SecB